MSELPAGVTPAREAEPRESASGIVLSRTGDRWQVLLGLRSRRTRFMPGHMAFPGGRLEPTDRPQEPGAHARCVAREVLEETGLNVPPGDWTEAGLRVTPPLFPVRFSTRFFVVRAPVGVAPEPADGENESLTFADPDHVLEGWARGKLLVPPPVLPILRVLARAEGDLDATARLVARTNEQEQRAPRIEFTPGVWMLPQRTATLPPATHTNTWMPGEERFIIVDPGSTEARENRRLLEVVERRRRLGHEPVAVVLTHHHQDHVSGARQIAEELGLPVRAHRRTLTHLAADLHGVESRPVDEGDEIDLGRMRLRVLHTPGHAIGHICLLSRDRGVLLAGDLISGTSTILIDPEQGDMGAYIESLDRVRQLDCGTLLPGHGPPLPARELDRLAEHRRRREDRILGLLESQPRPVDEIARGAYEDVPQAPPVLAERQTLAHLLLLERQGRAIMGDPAGRSWSCPG